MARREENRVAFAHRPRCLVEEEWADEVIDKQRTSGDVKVFGCRPHDGGAAHTGAGVRKPPREETAGCRARCRSDAMGFDGCRARVVSTTFAIWHELCEWVKHLSPPL